MKLYTRHAYVIIHTLVIVGTIETLSLSSEILSNASSLKYGEPLRSLKQRELPSDWLGKKRVLCRLLLSLSILLVLLFLLITRGGSASMWLDCCGNINFNIFDIEEASRDFDQRGIQVTITSCVEFLRAKLQWKPYHIDDEKIKI